MSLEDQRDDDERLALLAKVLSTPLALLSMMSAIRYTPAEAITCVVLATQCTFASSHKIDDVVVNTEKSAPVVEYSCASHNILPESPYRSSLLYITLGITLYTFGLLSGIILERYWQGRRYDNLRDVHNLRDVQTQSPTTYTALRGATTPRFLPLPDSQWG